MLQTGLNGLSAFSILPSIHLLLFHPNTRRFINSTPTTPNTRNIYTMRGTGLPSVAITLILMVRQYQTLGILVFYSLLARPTSTATSKTADLGVFPTATIVPRSTSIPSSPAFATSFATSTHSTPFATSVLAPSEAKFHNSPVTAQA